MMTLPALLLLGPTGSGKTPLGHALERTGLNDRKLVHFDFGEQLRIAASFPDRFPALGKQDIEVARNVLVTGALLSDAEFSIAAGIFRSFTERMRDGTATVVMNGLPRHTGQAEAIAGLVHMEYVVVLACSPEIARERIARNSGGDRSNRVDDAPEDITRKLTIYREQTEPLIEYYRWTGAAVIDIEIGIDTGPAGIITVLEERIDS